MGTCIPCTHSYKSPHSSPGRVLKFYYRVDFKSLTPKKRYEKLICERSEWTFLNFQENFVEKIHFRWSGWGDYPRNPIPLKDRLCSLQLVYHLSICSDRAKYQNSCREVLLVLRINRFFLISNLKPPPPYIRLLIFASLYWVIAEPSSI